MNSAPETQGATAVPMSHGEPQSRATSGSPRARSRSPPRVGILDTRDQDLAYPVPAAAGGDALPPAAAHMGERADGESTRQQSTSPRHVEEAPSVPRYPDVNPDDWVARVVGKNAMGSPTICIIGSDRISCARRRR